MTRCRLIGLACALFGFGAVCSPGAAHPLQVVTEATAYSYLKDGKVQGAATEIVEATLRRAGVRDFRIGLYPWARAYDQALKEPNVLIYLIARTPPREALFKWAGEFMQIQYHLYRRRDRPELRVSSLAEARGYSVGVVRDDVRHQYLRGKDFSKLVVSASNADNFRKLVNRQVDLVALTDSDLAVLCRDTNTDCSTLDKALTLNDIGTGIYMAFSLATPDRTVERVRSAFSQLRAEGKVVERMLRVAP